jgi:hypothetical protein
MPASEAQIHANRQNALKSTGPKTAEGKERSRVNAIKHGLTGEGIVLTVQDAAEVERRAAAYQSELRPTTELGRGLARRMAILSVRMDRSVMQETAALSERVRRAQDEAEANGEDPVEAGRRAMFDPSREACLARKYEAAAERGFFRALKELRQAERQARVEPAAPKAAAAPEKLGSSLPAEPIKTVLASLPVEPARVAPPSLPKPSKSSAPAWNPASIGSFEVPFTIGRPR